MFSLYLLPLWAFFGITFHYPHLRKVSDQSVSVQKIRTRVFQIFTLFLAAGLSDKVGRDGEVAGKGIMSGKTELVQYCNIWYWYRRTNLCFSDRRYHFWDPGWEVVNRMCGSGKLSWKGDYVWKNLFNIGIGVWELGLCFSDRRCHHWNPGCRWCPLIVKITNDI